MRWHRAGYPVSRSKKRTLKLFLTTILLLTDIVAHAKPHYPDTDWFKKAGLPSNSGTRGFHGAHAGVDGDTNTWAQASNLEVYN